MIRFTQIPHWISPFIESTRVSLSGMNEGLWKIPSAVDATASSHDDADSDWDPPRDVPATSSAVLRLFLTEVWTGTTTYQMVRSPAWMTHLIA